MRLREFIAAIVGLAVVVDNPAALYSRLGPRRKF
jgi:hypothetical protein